MKAIIFICVLALALADEDFDIQNCLEDPQSRGECSSGEKYYYDYKRGSCRLYPLDCDSYTNKNIFDSEEDCIDKCGSTPKEIESESRLPQTGYFVLDFNITEFDTINCLRSPDQGTCPYHTRMYYFDFNDRSCKPFTYHGCGGNENRFLYKGVCEEVCGDVYYRNECDLPPERGPCTGHRRMYYFEVKTRQCRRFSYSGCGGNDNKFPTEEECVQRCGNHVSEK